MALGMRQRTDISYVSCVLAGLVMLAAALVPPSPARAQQSDDGNSLADATKPARIVEFAEAIGSAELGKDSQGDPKISGRALGLKYWIYFYGCNEGKSCETIQLFSTFDQKGMTIDRVRAWNASHNYSEAYVEADGDSSIEMVLVLKGGVSEDNLRRQFHRWRVVLQAFAKHIGFR